MKTMKYLLGIACAVLLVTAGIGVLHLPVARPLLSWIGFGCPVRAAPEEVEAARLASGRAIRGDTPSPARPALGFSLDQMTRAEVDAWVTRQGLACEELQRGTVLKCSAVRASALPELRASASTRPPVGAEGAIDDLTFGFEPSGLRLVTVTTLRNQLDAPGAASLLREITGGLDRSLGPGRAVGEPTAAHLSAGRMSTALVEYRFHDYLASVTATSFGDRVVLREHYMSVMD